MRHDYGYFEEDHLAKSSDLKLWRRIMVYSTPRWKEILGAIVLSLAITGCSLALPHLVRLAIDNFIINQIPDTATRIQGVSRLAGFFMILLLAGFFTNFLQVVLLEWTGQKIMHRMRQDLFAHMLSLETSFFNRNPVGKLVTRLTNDIQNMHEMFTSVIVTLFNDLVRIFGILIILMMMNWRLALLMLLLVPLIIFNTILFSRLARFAFRDIRTQLARLNSFIQEALSGVSIIQLFSREKDSVARFEEQNEIFKQRTFYQIKIFSIFMPMLELLSAVAVALIIWYGGGQVIQDKMTIGILVAFLSYMRLFFQPLRELSQKYSIVQSSLASAERIFQLLDTDGKPSLPKPTLYPIEITGEVRFTNVTFGYEPKTPVVKNLSLKAAAGETIAIVGGTGAGKTTIINLLERFYDPDQGQIFLDDNNLKDLDVHFLREQIGLVTQEVYIFPVSFRDNIVLDKNLSPERLNEIIEAAQLSFFLSTLPEGLETIIGEGGRDLSAGQRQLLALARVLARDPKILILDEATSSVDTETEILIEKALDVTLANRTSIIIAHRLSTIRRADRIIVLENGLIAEEGDHSELMAGKGIYYQLQSLQNGANVKI